MVLEPVPPVYNVARRLCEQLKRSTQKVPVNDKRGTIADVERNIVNLMRISVKANRCVNNAEARANFIRSAQDIILDIELDVRIMFDLGIIKPKGFAQLMRIEDDISGQLYSWMRSTVQSK